MILMSRNIKIENSVKKLINEEEKFGIKNFKTYQEFGEKVYEIRKNVIKNISKLKKKEKVIIGFGAPAKATTALNFFGIKKEINYIVEDNNLKHNKIDRNKDMVKIKESDNLKIVTGDIRDPFFCRTIVKDVDVVYHAHALMHV